MASPLAMEGVEASCLRPVVRDLLEGWIAALSCSADMLWSGWIPKYEEVIESMRKVAK
jgi:hypothetical protein